MVNDDADYMINKMMVNDDGDYMVNDGLYLVGGKTNPLKNNGVSNSWDDDIPNWMESHNPVMFQSPPIRYLTIIFPLFLVYTIFNHYKNHQYTTKAWQISRRVTYDVAASRGDTLRQNADPMGRSNFLFQRWTW